MRLKRALDDWKLDRHRVFVQRTLEDYKIRDKMVIRYINSRQLKVN